MNLNLFPDSNYFVGRRLSVDIFTIGHSTHTIQEFIFVMQEYNIDLVVDIRCKSKSSQVPHFNNVDMKKWLNKENIEYLHLPELGANRKHYADVEASLVAGWEKKEFRNYASYSLSPQYDQGINKIIKQAKKKTLCIMGAEIVPWRCHRLIISNSLVHKGEHVIHILGEDKLAEHELALYGARAIVYGNRLIYPKTT